MYFMIWNSKQMQHNKQKIFKASSDVSEHLALRLIKYNIVASDCAINYRCITYTR